MRFIGCKENILDFIGNFIEEKNIRGDIFCDLFSGTASVAKYFKRKGYEIISSDLLYFSYILQKTYVEQNEYPRFLKLSNYLKINPVNNSFFNNESKNASAIIEYLNSLEGIEGFIFKNYSPGGTEKRKYTRKYFIDDNAKKIDSIREKIEKWNVKKLINEKEYYFLLCSLIEAVPFVSNISGVYGAFLKNWDKRAFKKIILKVPEIIKSNKKHKSYNGNGIKVLDEIKNIGILYLDPPYNERQYVPNYHILETIAKWDKPKIKGVTGMRPYLDQKSDFCNAKKGKEALEKILNKKNFKNLLLSYNSEGIIPEKEILALFKKFGKVEIIEQDYQRYKSNSNGKQEKKVKEKIYYLKVVNNKNEINDLSGSEWIYFLNSVESTHYSTNGKNGFAHHIRSKHPSPKPPQLMKKFIEFFTKEDQLVFDPFVGVGGTLIGCSLSNRRGIGIDLSKKYIELYRKACKDLKIEEQTTIIGDANNIDKLIDKKTVVDLILTDPPYGEMLTKKRTGQIKKKNRDSFSTPFTNHKQDLGNMTRKEFLNSLKNIIQKSVKYLKLNGYVAVFVKDLQPKNKEHNMLHCDVTNKLLEIEELSFRGYKIWYDATQKLYPFGYPYTFVSNQFHQFIMIFRKEKNHGK